MDHPRYVTHASPTGPGALVLLLHGGRSGALEPPTRWNLPGLRMRPFARAIARECARLRPVVAHVRYRHRGWNGERADALQDAEEALRALLAAIGEVPVVLVGHSMGGRAALRAAAHPAVRGVVGLAPWCPPGEPVAHLAGKRLVLLHDRDDGVTDPHGTWALLDRARDAGAGACGVVLAGSDHAMLRRAGTWHTLAARLAHGLLLPAALPGPVSAALAASAGRPPELLTPARIPAVPAAAVPAPRQDGSGRP
ncbi:alpha/beta fold hydrolase [Streptomyces sp. TRM 70351]|uniref:alpha/beta fold hydrolase n=1 Tax=Streptomyces sp. TRM 70351 TaxID=3116552 RepID=UPI002E7AD692|nr:alpha/beta fold hydrolase [Streptomyces sp. TRM 70351]MEE1928644.1 alpha/beta fold hydrolase [Streptomyces sp. TRM 70351]